MMRQQSDFDVIKGRPCGTVAVVSVSSGRITLEVTIALGSGVSVYRHSLSGTPTTEVLTCFFGAEDGVRFQDIGHRLWACVKT